MRPWTIALSVASIATPIHAETPAWKQLATHENGQLARATLLRDLAIGPVTCQKGQDFGRHPNGKLSFCTVAVGTLVDGVPIAAGAYTLFHSTEKLWQTTTSKPMTFKLTSGASVDCAADLISLDESGPLEYCKLTTSFKGKPATCLVANGASFWPTGALRSCAVDAPYPALGATLPKGTFLSWFDDGLLAGGTAPSIILGGYPVYGEFTLHRNGKLAELALESPAKVAGHEFPSGAKLKFRTDATLESAHFVEKSGFMIHGEQWTDTRYETYDSKGKVLTTRVEHWQSSVRPPKFR